MVHVCVVATVIVVLVFVIYGWCDCGWIVVLLLCGVNVSVVLRLLQLGLCCTVLDTVAGSVKWLAF